MNKHKPIRIKGINGIKEFDNMFDAIQYQKTTPMGRLWLNTPMQVIAYPRLNSKKAHSQ
jgi:hypothetical protein